MHNQLTPDPQFEIIKYLYQFKDDNKFYKLDENSLRIRSEKEKHISIHTLRDNAFIATDTELYYNHNEENLTGYFTTPEEIRARILPKGVVAVESALRK